MNNKNGRYEFLEKEEKIRNTKIRKMEDLKI